jgi:hypothetical protein
MRGACASSKFLVFTPFYYMPGWTYDVIYRVPYTLNSLRDLDSLDTSLAEVFFIPQFNGNSLEILAKGMACTEEYIYFTSDGSPMDGVGRIYRLEVDGPANQTATVVTESRGTIFNTLSITPDSTSLFSVISQSGKPGYTGQIDIALGEISSVCSDSADLGEGTVVTQNNTLVYSEARSNNLCYFSVGDSCNVDFCNTAAGQLPILEASTKPDSSSVYTAKDEMRMTDGVYTKGKLLPSSGSPQGWLGLVSLPGSSC